MNVLVVEDEDRIATFLVKGLTARGYDVRHVSTGTAAIDAAPGAGVVLLDLGLPDSDGFDVLEAIRARSPAAQVIVLTARGHVADRVEGLERGADDYLVKPFAFEELVARIRRRVRAAQETERNSLAHEDVELDLIERRVKVGGKTHDLPDREFDVLKLLMQAAGGIVDRRTLLAEVWGFETFEPRSNPDEVYISLLRKRLGRDRIETVRGRGYRLRSHR
jgi:two-component system copper resistance phosphate regulon response regulator CusR